MVQLLYQTMPSFQKKIFLKQLLQDPASTLVGRYSKEFKACSQKDVYTRMFIAMSFTIAKRQKPAKCRVVNEWKRNAYICTVDYYSALKRKEALTSATAQKNLDHMMLREINSHKEIKTVCFPLHDVFQNSHTNRNKAEWQWPGAGGEEVFDRVRVSMLQGKKQSQKSVEQQWE